MAPETRNCKTCQQDFIIDSEDFSFYEKIKVPAPTNCPHCRMMRRMLWRNERSWSRRICAATGKAVLSMYPEESGIIVYDQAYWRSDAWNPISYGREYDSSRGFFEQFRDLLYEIPHPNLNQKNCVRSDFSNHTSDLKNCYFSASAVKCEDCAYLFTAVRNMRDSYDCHQTSKSERCYELIDSWKCNALLFGQNSETCSDSAFMYDCRNCTDCFGCVGLRNAQYQIYNQQYTKEEYRAHMKELRSGSYAALENAREQFEALKLTVPRKYAAILNGQNVSGDDIIDARNCHDCFFARDNVENCRYCYRVWDNTKDGYDGIIAWEGCELFCDVLSVTAQRVYFSAYIWGGHDVEYSYHCFDCTNIFGCVGLRSASYCIFNRQYSKEEYEALVPQIREAMRASGEYGEFFPVSMSPFAYNETITQDYFPTTRDEALAAGYVWREPSEKKYTPTVTAADLPDMIADVADTITSDIIGCANAGKGIEQCATAFRIVPEELQFYRTMRLPLPRYCPSCRHFARVNLKNPLALWHRACMCEHDNHDHAGKCPNEFETSYSPDRPELVYCESCYQKEVV